MSLSLVIAITASLLSYIIKTDQNSTYVVASAMTTILCGGLILHILNEADKLAETIGGKIDNSFGKKLIDDTKNMWSSTKKFTMKLIKAWASS